jgi:hypothetical protein
MTLRHTSCILRRTPYGRSALCTEVLTLVLRGHYSECCDTLYCVASCSMRCNVTTFFCVAACSAVLQQVRVVERGAHVYPARADADRGGRLRARHGQGPGVATRVMQRTWHVVRGTCHVPAKGLCHLSCRMFATCDEQRANVASCGVVMCLQNASCYSPRGNMVRRVCNRG